ncbi:MAG: hypothetical protein KKI12_05370 [Proteobacteria bacterium]|nr:hypothetical protein [Pseudomonadota bacterium]MBU4287587.1 hypothetical protein [Pseudomonadota bacterium]MCG2831512.1 hypothetical protein [Desulfobacteraceae bacterium]
MCGICGIYNLDQQPVAMELIRRMNNTLVHRGSDDEGYYVNAGKRGGEEANLTAKRRETLRKKAYNKTACLWFVVQKS